MKANVNISMEIMFELNESEVVDFEADRGLKYLCQMRNYTFD